MYTQWVRLSILSLLGDNVADSAWPTLSRKVRYSLTHQAHFQYSFVCPIFTNNGWIRLLCSTTTNATNKNIRHSFFESHLDWSATTVRFSTGQHHSTTLVPYDVQRSMLELSNNHEPKCTQTRKIDTILRSKITGYISNT